MLGPLPVSQGWTESRFSSENSETCQSYVPSQACQAPAHSPEGRSSPDGRAPEAGGSLSRVLDGDGGGRVPGWQPPGWFICESSLVAYAPPEAWLLTLAGLWVGVSSLNRNKTEKRREKPAHSRPERNKITFEKWETKREVGFLQRPGKGQENEVWTRKPQANCRSLQIICMIKEKEKKRKKRSSCWNLWGQWPRVETVSYNLPHFQWEPARTGQNSVNLF